MKQGFDDDRTWVGESGEESIEATHDAPPEHPNLRAGPAMPDRVGRYLISARVGAGAMGVVFAAWDPELERKVAIKFLDGARHSATAHHRILREAQAMARLDHPNVVGIHDVGEYDGRVYLVMSFVEGQTLADWLAATPRSWRAIAAVFGLAGRGLAAAHAAGLVHRDFKPQNVMIDDAGHVQVMDFGLARASVDEAELATPLEVDDDLASEVSSTLATEVTKQGQLVGTPAYMAPELLAGLSADARSDQFAFCVALYRALYHQRPFGGDDLASVVLAMTEGQLREPPKRGPVPRRLRELVVRGLAIQPERRWPDMDAIVSILEDDPTRARVGVGLGFVAVFAIVASLAVARSSTPLAPVCAGAERQLATVWTAPQRDAVAASFTALEPDTSWAAGAKPRVTAELDAYAAAWVLAHRDACEATRVRGEQSEAVLDQRMRCLDRARRELEVTVQVLAAGDREALERAVSAVEALPPLDRCADLDALARASSTLPLAPAQAQEAEALQAAVDRLAVLERTAQYSAGLAEIEALQARAEALGHGPTQAALARVHGALLAATGDYEGAAARHEAGFHAAVRARDWDRAQDLAIELAFVIGERLSQFEVGEHWLELAESLAADDPGEAAELATCRAALDYRSGHYDAALAQYQRSIELRGDRPSPDLAAAYNGLGLSYLRLSRPSESAEALRRAHALMTEVYGEGHPQVASVLINLASIQAQSGDLEGALVTFAEAQAVLEREFGPSHPNIGVILVNVAGISRRQGDYAGAKAAAERAVEIYTERFGEDHPKRAVALTILSNVELSLVELDAADVHASEGLRISEASYGPDHAGLVTPLLGLARVRRAQARPDEALALIERARTQTGDQPILADVVTERERVLRQSGRPPGSSGATPIEDLAAALALCETIDCGALDQAELLFADARRQAKDSPDAAQSQIARARALLVDAPATPLQGELLAQLDTQPD